MTVPKFASALACLLLASATTLVSAAPLRRQRSLPLLKVDADAQVPLEEIRVFESEYGRLLSGYLSVSMSMTNAPVILQTSEPMAALPSDFPSLTPKSLEPSGHVVVSSDFPSLSPSGSPTETAASPSPTTSVVSHTLVPSSSPTEGFASPSPTTPVVHTAAPSFSPTSAIGSDVPSSSPTAVPSSPLTEVPSSFPTGIPSSSLSAFPSMSPTGIPSSSPTDVPSSSPTGFPSSPPSAFPSLSPTGIPSSPLTDAPSSSPSEIPASDLLAPSSSPSSSPTAIPASDALAPSSSPTEIPSSIPIDFPSFFPTDIPASDALAPSSSPSVSPTEIPASDALAPSWVPSSAPTADSGTFLRRQRSRALMPAHDADNVEALLEEIRVFDSEYGRVLSVDLSMSMTNAPVALSTSEPTPVFPSDFPSLSPKSAEPSSVPTVSVVSHTAGPTPVPASHTAPPTVIPASDALAPSSSPTGHSVTPGDWVQLGKPIVPNWEGLVGMDIAMSADGSVIAVGIAGNLPGHIGVYRYNETSLEWDTMGDLIFDVFSEGSVRFGSAVAISADGNTVAAGSGFSSSIPDETGLSNPLAGRAQVNVFENGQWIQKGQSLVGTQCRSLGWSTALSGDGNRWVVGTPDVSGSGDARCSDIEFGSKRGVVQVFDFVNGGEWAQVGNVISGSQPGSQLGQAVAISRNGLRVAAFSQGIAGVDPYYQVFEQDAFGKWVQMGANIPVESAVATSSTNTMALSASGSRIVITNKRRDSGLGYFKVLEWTPETSSWTQMGSDMEDADGCCFFFAYDTSVAISDSGYKVVYGNTGYRDGIALEEDTSFFRGNIRVFEWIDGSWQQVGGSMLGDDLVGEVWFGYSTAMSADGRRIAASAPFAFPNYVAAYELPWN